MRRNQSNVITYQKEKIEEKIKVEELEKYYPRWPFSQKEWSFLPNENDWKIIRKEIPKIQIALTNRCNFLCKLCYTNSTHDDFSSELSKAEIIKILKRVGKNKKIILIGGEPTVREDLFEIIKLIRKSGNIPEIYTNGIKLADFSYAKKLKECGIKKIYFSFDGFDKDYYKIMNFDNENILLLKLLALKNIETLGINTVISSRIVKGLNEKEIKKIISFCINSVKNNGNIKGVLFYGATPYGRFLENWIIKSKELIENLELATNGVASLEYMMECKKFLLLLHNYLRKFGIYTSYGTSGLIGLFKAGSIKRFFSLSSLKTLNLYLERGGIKKVLLETKKNIKLKELFICLGKMIREKNSINDIFLLLPSSFFIGVGFVNTPINMSFIYRDSAEIFKERDSHNIFVRYAGYGKTAEMT